MIGIVFKGRPAWIAGMIFGLILAIIGFATGMKIWLITVGGLFFIFGLVMLIISITTKGQSD